MLRTQEKSSDRFWKADWQPNCPLFSIDTSPQYCTGSPELEHFGLSRVPKMGFVRYGLGFRGILLGRFEFWPDCADGSRSFESRVSAVPVKRDVCVCFECTGVSWQPNTPTSEIVPMKTETGSRVMEQVNRYNEASRKQLAGIRCHDMDQSAVITSHPVAAFTASFLKVR